MVVLHGFTNIVWGWKKVMIRVNTFVKPVKIVGKVTVHNLRPLYIIFISCYTPPETTETALSCTAFCANLLV